MMKRNIYLVIVTLFLSLSAGAKEKDVAIMQSMVKRLIPAYAENFLFPVGYFRLWENSDWR